MRKKALNVDQCKSFSIENSKKNFNFSDFEQEAGYPKQDTRFLDLSIRGLCTDEKGKVHDIHKELIIGKFEFDFDLIRLGFFLFQSLLNVILIK